MKKWAILDPYLENPSACMRRLIERHRGAIHFDTFVPSRGELPLANAYDGFIGLGSHAYVTDQEDWIKSYALFLETVLKQGKKVFGICFTHQLMAMHFGGRVDFIYPDQRGLKGLRKIGLSQDLFHFKNSIELVYTQHQRVFEIPAELESLGQSLFDFEILRHRNYPLLTFQAHPEASEDFCRNDALMNSAKEIQRAQHYGDAVIDSFLLS